MDMERYEYCRNRMAELQPHIPAWKHAEHMEVSVSEQSMWNNSFEIPVPHQKRTISPALIAHAICSLLCLIGIRS